MNYIEPYAKENNLLQLALFYFGKGKPEKTVVEWSDKKGRCELKCSCDEYGVPGSFEQDVYTATMRIWVKQKMPPTIKLNYSDIARELDLKPPKDWVGKIKRALQRLAHARYELKQCFIEADSEGRRRIDTHFSLYDSASLFQYNKTNNKRQSQSQLVFPDVIAKNLEAKYYQFLEMTWYRRLPDGLPRRLYEYLEKQRYHQINGFFKISEEALCRWLPITDQNTTNRRKRLKKIADELVKAGYLSFYHFDLKKKQCIFQYAQPGPPPPEEVVEGKIGDVVPVPKVRDHTQPTAHPAPTFQDTAMLSQDSIGQVKVTDVLEVIEWLQSIPYMHKGKIREIAALRMDQVIAVYPKIRAEYESQVGSGETHGPSWVHEQFWENVDAPASTPPEPKQEEHQEEVVDFPAGSNVQDHAGDLDKLLKLLKTQKISDKLHRALAQYLGEKGPDYVRWHILYANKSARKSYSAFLQKALAANWAEEFAQEQQEKEARKAQEIEVQMRQAEESRQQQLKQPFQKREQARFIERVLQLPEEIKRGLWEQARKKEGPGARKMLVSVEYQQRMQKYLVEQGEKFDEEALAQSGLDIAREIGREFSN